MNEIDKKIFFNKKEKEKININLNNKLDELKKIEKEIKKSENDIVILKKENKHNIIVKLFSILKVLFAPLIMIILLGYFINKYFYFAIIVALFYLGFSLIKNTKYERYNLSKESIEKLSNIKVYYENSKNKLDKEIGELLIKIDDLDKENLKLNIESEKIKVKEAESRAEIEKYISQRDNVK